MVRARMLDANNHWPALPLEAWRDTCETLHRWTQIMGKVQLACTPLMNHWWNVGLQVTPRGLATSTMTAPDDRWFDLELDLFADALRIRVSDGTSGHVALTARSVAAFYADTIEALRELGLLVRISPKPSEIVDADEAIPFPDDRMHHAYDKHYVLAFWQILARVTHVMSRFRAGYIGKSSPPLFFWGHFDLSLSLFSGRPMPAAALAQMTDKLDREGYSHEQFGVGWWPGDTRLAKPVFYAAAAPEPTGFAATRLATRWAYYEPSIHAFCLDYGDVRTVRDPEELILDFFHTSYTAAAALGGWDRQALERAA